MAWNPLCNSTLYSVCCSSLPSQVAMERFCIALEPVPYQACMSPQSLVWIDSGSSRTLLGNEEFGWWRRTLTLVLFAVAQIRRPVRSNLSHISQTLKCYRSRPDSLIGSMADCVDNWHIYPSNASWQAARPPELHQLYKDIFTSNSQHNKLSFWKMGDGTGSLGLLNPGLIR
jgi:hypothetical protein